jgi:hypothetical protein
MIKEKEHRFSKMKHTPPHSFCMLQKQERNETLQKAAEHKGNGGIFFF